MSFTGTDTDDSLTKSIRESYDELANEYALRIYDELQQKPFDRELLDRYASIVKGRGEVCDMGCGPGHVTRYLREGGIDAFGLDLSPRMLEQARRLNPDIKFLEGNMLSLSFSEKSVAGIVAFYSICNLPEDSLSRVFSEMQQVLKPGGLILLAFHIGNEIIHRDEMWGRKVSIDFFLFQTSTIQSLLKNAGFSIIESFEREPYGPEIEYQSRRAYIFAQKSE